MTKVVIQKGYDMLLAKAAETASWTDPETLLGLGVVLVVAGGLYALTRMFKR